MRQPFGTMTVIVAALVAMVGMAPAPAVAQYGDGIYDDYGWYDDDLTDDWFYDTYDPGFYDPTFYDYGPYGAFDWYDYEYAGVYDDEWADDDWYYDEYELGHWDPWGYDDPGEAGFWDV